MPTTPDDGPEPSWHDVVPRWLKAWLLLATLTASTLFVARLSSNSTIVPAAVFLGATSGPLAFAIWVTDRTRVGRSVAPDVLFATSLVGGGIAITIAGFFESEFFFPRTGPGYLWVGVIEETAKVIIPLALTVLVPKYRSVEQALALAVVTAAGFAVFESMAYVVEGLDVSITEARRVLFVRSVVTPFGHLPWTGLAVVVAATEWEARGRVRLTPRALWGLAAAIALHTMWNLALVEAGWWWLLVPVVASTTFLLFRWVLNGVFYEGPAVVPAERYIGNRRRRRQAGTTDERADSPPS